MHVGIGAAEHRQRLLPVQRLPVRVGAGEVAVEGAELAVFRRQQQRQMGGLQARRAVAGEQRQTGAFDLGVQGGQVILPEGGGSVHGGHLG